MRDLIDKHVSADLLPGNGESHLPSVTAFIPPAGSCSSEENSVSIFIDDGCTAETYLCDGIVYKENIAILIGKASPVHREA